jgi:hypothetical protein
LFLSIYYLTFCQQSLSIPHIHHFFYNYSLPISLPSHFSIYFNYTAEVALHFLLLSICLNEIINIDGKARRGRESKGTESQKEDAPGEVQGALDFRVAERKGKPAAPPNQKDHRRSNRPPLYLPTHPEA